MIKFLGIFFLFVVYLQGFNLVNDNLVNSCIETQKVSRYANKEIPELQQARIECDKQDKVSFSTMLHILDRYYEVRGPTIGFERLAKLFLKENDISKIMKTLILGHFFDLAEYYIEHYNEFRLNATFFKNHRTLLHVATLNENYKAVQFLLKHYADISILDSFGFKPTFYINSKKMAKLYKKFNIKVPDIAKCSIYLDEEKIDKALKYCYKKAQLCKKHNYNIGASWYYLLAKKATLSKEFSQKIINHSPYKYIGYANLAHYCILEKDIEKAKEYYAKFKDFVNDDKLTKKSLLEDFTILRKIYKTDFDIYTAFEIKNLIFDTDQYIVDLFKKTYKGR